MSSTLEMMRSFSRNNLSRIASEQGKQLSPGDIADDDPNLDAAVVVNHLYAKAREKVTQDPTRDNLLEMNRFDESCNLLAASKPTYDLYKKLQEQALPIKSRAIENHEQYERVLNETEKQNETLQTTLTMLTNNVVNRSEITPETEQQIKVAKQEQKKFVDMVEVVAKAAETSHIALKSLRQEAAKAAAERTMMQTPSEGPR
jgi:hypothetical protein